MKCWAGKLGGCGGGQSREHYISKNLFPSGKVVVSGFKWCTEPIELPVSQIGANVLCSNHNSALSSLDTGAGDLRRGLLEIHQRIEERDTKAAIRGVPPYYRVSKHNVDGPTTERWMLKCVIGLFTANPDDKAWSASGTPPMDPPLELVEAVYGRRVLNFPTGLYIAIDPTEPLYLMDGFRIVTYSHDGTLRESGIPPKNPDRTAGFAGAAIYFMSIRFLIWLSPELISPFTTDTGVEFNEGANKPHFRPDVYTFNVHGLPSSELIFRWPAFGWK
jgi:hypothetical protein